MRSYRSEGLGFVVPDRLIPEVPIELRRIVVVAPQTSDVAGEGTPPCADEGSGLLNVDMRVRDGREGVNLHDSHTSI